MVKCATCMELKQFNLKLRLCFPFGFNSYKGNGTNIIALLKREYLLTGLCLDNSDTISLKHDEIVITT